MSKRKFHGGLRFHRLQTSSRTRNPADAVATTQLASPRVGLAGFNCRLISKPPYLISWCYCDQQSTDVYSLQSTQEQVYNLPLKTSSKVRYEPFFWIRIESQWLRA